MTNQLPYKEIYKLAKQRVEEFAGLIGKTVVPMQQQPFYHLNQTNNEEN